MLPCENLVRVKLNIGVIPILPFGGMFKSQLNGSTGLCVSMNDRLGTEKNDHRQNPSQSFNPQNNQVITIFS